MARSKKEHLPSGFTKIVYADTKNSVLTGSENLVWIKHPRILPTATDFEKEVGRVLRSWENQFGWISENLENDILGLRLPQIGAVHAIHAHLAVSKEPATIVMPTGTGKTEVMLSALVSLRCPRLLIITPTDILRSQIATKFLELGILRKGKIASDRCFYPIVGTLTHLPKDPDEVDEFFTKSNVIVTTMQVAGQCEEIVQKRMAFHCPYLFIDEAHHIAALTWDRFRKNFGSNYVFQFTATPFRNDGKHVGGKIIFNYRMSKAQKDGYFKSIRFTPVVEFDPNKSDEAIARRAIEQLREDVGNNYTHILMARTETVARASDVLEIYQRLGREFKPVQLHTGMSNKERSENRRKILKGESKIVVCVDMLGEGFDLPELKIAAFHDVKKSLAVTLQLAGRFVRSKPAPPVGDPTFIANVGNVKVNEELRTLYFQDADWNVLLRKSSEGVIQKQVDLSCLIDGFKGSMKSIPLQYLRPAMSTIVYRTKCSEWRPENFAKGIDGFESFESVDHDVNQERDTLVVVLGKRVPVEWARVADVFTWDWELLIIIWDRNQNLLFINSSSNSGYYKKLAQAVAGMEAELVIGPEVFRCLSGVNRLILQNVGLIDQIGRLVRYTMRAGSDVEAGLTAAQKWNTSKGNIFGLGYEEGEKTSIGCSYKGRIWSRKVCDLDTLIKWCIRVGEKLLNEEIDPDEIVKGTLEPTAVSSRPDSVPVAVEWPEIVYDPNLTFKIIVNDGTEFDLDDAEIKLKDMTANGDLKFEVCSETTSICFTLDLFEKSGGCDCGFAKNDRRDVVVRFGSQSPAICEFFYDNPPVIWFADGSSLRGATLYRLRHIGPPYARERILPWHWIDMGVNIRKESQTTERLTDSIQYGLISKLVKDGNFDVVFDDDGPGEVADVVAIRAEEDKIIIQLYHCKFSKEDCAGARIEDLYEVCGQAQKNISWLDNPSTLFRHLLRRKQKNDSSGQSSRFEKGDENALLSIEQMSYMKRVSTSVYIVQPGLSKSKASEEQLALLSVTENYLMQTYKLPFTVIASD